MKPKFEDDDKRMGVEYYQKDYADLLIHKSHIDEIKRNRWFVPLSLVIMILTLILSIISVILQVFK